MKTNYIIPTLALLFFVFTTKAQQGINYKAIINDANGDALLNTAVTVQFTILESGTISVYKESHSPTTDANGIIIVNIGEGILISGDFTNIDWGGNPHFLKTEIDKGNGLTDMGTAEFKTVPYALYAKTAERVSSTFLSSIDNLLNLAFQTESIDNLLSAGFSVAEIYSSGRSVSDLLSDGVSVPELLSAGASVSELFDSGAGVGTLEQNGITHQDLIEAGLIGTLNDYDGNRYKWVKIGIQEWMAENLSTSRYNDGNAIPLVTEDSFWKLLTTPAYCWPNNDQSTAVSNGYGALYNWYTVETNKLCPTGWHVPTDDEWKELEMFLGMSRVHADLKGHRGTNQGSRLAGNASLWQDGELKNNPEFGSSGFSGLPVGLRDNNGSFWPAVGATGFWWSATENYIYEAWDRINGYTSATFNRGAHAKEYGLSVRCLRD